MNLLCLFGFHKDVIRKSLAVPNAFISEFYACERCGREGVAKLILDDQPTDLGEWPFIK